MSNKPANVEHPDTVADAAATPDTAMPYAELGLKDDEYAPLISMLLAFVGSITVLLGVIGVLPAFIPPVAKAAP